MKEVKISKTVRKALIQSTAVVVLLIAVGSYTYTSQITLEAGVHTYD